MQAGAFIVLALMIATRNRMIRVREQKATVYTEKPPLAPDMPKPPAPKPAAATAGAEGAAATAATATEGKEDA